MEFLIINPIESKFNELILIGFNNKRLINIFTENEFAHVNCQLTGINQFYLLYICTHITLYNIYVYVTLYIVTLGKVYDSLNIRAFLKCNDKHMTAH